MPDILTVSGMTGLGNVKTFHKGTDIQTDGGTDIGAEGVGEREGEIGNKSSSGEGGQETGGVR